MKTNIFWGESTDYYWDDWGVIINTQLRNGIQTVMMVDIRWNLTIDEGLEFASSENLRNLAQSMKEDNPKTYFKGNILVGGMPLGRMTNVKKDFMKENELLFFHRHRGDRIAEHRILDSYELYKT